MSEIEKLSKKIDLLIQGQDEPMTAEQTCKYLGIAKPTLYKLTTGRKIPHYKPTGSKLYFKKSELNRYAFGNKIKGIDEGN